MNTAFRSHFKHFGRLLGKIYLFLTPSKTDGRVPSQQGAPATCNLQPDLQTCSDITGQFGCGGGGGGSEGVDLKEIGCGQRTKSIS